MNNFCSSSDKLVNLLNDCLETGWFKYKVHLSTQFLNFLIDLCCGRYGPLFDS